MGVRVGTPGARVGWHLGQGVGVGVFAGAGGKIQVPLELHVPFWLLILQVAPTFILGKRQTAFCDPAFRQTLPSAVLHSGGLLQSFLFLQKVGVGVAVGPAMGDEVGVGVVSRTLGLFAQRKLESQ